MFFYVILVGTWRLVGLFSRVFQSLKSQSNVTGEHQTVTSIAAVLSTTLPIICAAYKDRPRPEMTLSSSTGITCLQL